MLNSAKTMSHNQPVHRQVDSILLTTQSFLFEENVSLFLKNEKLFCIMCAWFECWFWPSQTQWAYYSGKVNPCTLRGAWRDHRLPEPFSWFLHETGLESLKITSVRCFLLKCQRKDSKKAKEYRRFRGVIGRWRTAAIDRTTFHACQWCRKTVVLAVFSRLWGVIWRGKAFRDQQCQFLTRNKSLSSENESNSFDDFWVRAYRFDFPRGAGLEHGRCKQSIFSLSIFDILVERLSF